MNSKGQHRPKKHIRNLKNCLKNCQLKCSQKICNTERISIFENYYKQDQTGKYAFLLCNTERSCKKRTTIKTPSSRRKYTFSYSFTLNGQKILVCQKFFLGTLAISQRPIYTAHSKKDPLVGSLTNSERGMSSKKKISDSKIKIILDHINSFPNVESHYCRAKSNKKYLDQNLNITKMYDLYSKKCNDINEEPVKSSYYRYIFNTRTNLDFQKPKSDLCGLCELFKIHPDRVSVTEYENHIALKNSMRELKAADKESGIPILCFDMQKVIGVPKCNIDASYYLSKLNIFNLTAHLSTTKTVYCAIWHEQLNGRTGNNIASAFYKILEHVFEENNITHLITWSDSCVPQNKNSYIAYAVQLFLKQHSEVEIIEMRYSLAGHSCIQEVDNAHMQIERVLNKNEFYSPLGLIRLMKDVNRKRPYRILELNENDFYNYESCAKKFNYRVVPFSSLKMIRYSQQLITISYSLNYDTESYKDVSIRPPERRNRKKGATSGTSENDICDPPKDNKNKSMANNKVADLKAMFKYMPNQDVSFYKDILNL